MNEWKTIETAPKMNIVLLFAVTDIGKDGSAKNWKMATGWWHTGAECWVWDDGNQVRKYDIQPTHWQPLPAPPVEQAKTEVVGS
jgi:hypothetical protein